MPAAPTNLEAWVARDHELEVKASRSTLALMEHRWRAVREGGHSIAAYSRAIGRATSVVSRYVRGWELYHERKNLGSQISPDAAMELANMGEAKAEAHEIVAEARGIPVGRVRKELPHVAAGVRAEIQRRVDSAVERGESAEEAHATAVASARRDQALREHAMDARAKRAETNAGRAGFFAWNGIQKELGKARRAMRDAVQLMRESGITDAEFLETLAGVSAQIRELTALFDLAVAERRGEQIDWDSAASELLD